MATQLIPHSFLFPWVSLPWTTGKFKNFPQNPCEEPPQHPFAPVNPKQPGDALFWARICLKTVRQTVVMHAFHSLRSETKDMVNMVNPILGEKHKRSGTNQKPERRRPFRTGVVRHCPQGLFSPFFTFLRAIFFRPFTLSLAPTIRPWVWGWVNPSL